MHSYDDLFLFIDIVHHGGFTQASRKLGLSQSQLSRRLQKLEQSLGNNLFRRLANRVELTEFGKEIFQRFSQQKWQLDTDIEQHINKNAATNNDLNIILPAVFGYHIISPYLPAFLKQHPDLKLHIKYTHGSASLYETGADYMITSRMPEQQTLIVKKLCACSCGFYCSNKYVSLHGLPLHPSDLEYGTHLVASYDSANVTNNQELIFTHKVSAESLMVTNKTRLLINDDLQAEKMLDSHQLIVGCYDFCLAKREDVIRLFADYDLFDITFYKVTPPNKNDIKVALFHQFIETCLQQAQLI